PPQRLRDVHGLGAPGDHLRHRPDRPRPGVPAPWHGRASATATPASTAAATATTTTAAAAAGAGHRPHEVLRRPALDRLHRADGVARFADLLCVPSFKSLTGPPSGNPPPPNPPPPFDLDHFKCYMSAGAAANQPQAVTLFDQFFPNGQTDTVTQLRYLCNPTT